MTYRNLAVASLFIFISSLLQGCGSAEEKRDKYVEKGISYINEDNFDKARVEFKNAIQIDPKYSLAYYHIGEVEEKTENLKDALGYYSKAVELDPNLTKARTKLARIWIVAQRFDDAKKEIDEILRRDPENSDGKVLQAFILYRNDDKEGAFKIVQKVFEADPKNQEAAGLLAGIYAQTGKTDAAKDVLRKSIAATKENRQSVLVLARIEDESGNTDEAEKLFKQLADKTPDVVNLVNFYVKKKQFDDAEKFLRGYLSKNQEEMERHLLLAQFLAAHKKPTDSAAVLNEAIKKLPSKYELRFALASLYANMKEHEKSQEIYNGIIQSEKLSSHGLNARIALARDYVSVDRHPEAENLVNEVLKESPKNPDALLLRGGLALKRGDPATAVTAYRGILSERPDSSEVLTLLAEAHMRNKETDLAGEALKKVVELNPKDAASRLRLAGFYAIDKDYKNAHAEIDNILKIDPKNLYALEAQIKLYVAEKKYLQAHTSADAVISAYPIQPIGYVLKGEINFIERKFSESADNYILALSFVNDNKVTLNPLARIMEAYFQTNTPQKGIAYFLKYKDSHKDNPYIDGLLAQLYAATGDKGRAESSYALAIQANPQWDVPYIGLSTLKSGDNETDTAIDTIKQGLAAIKNSERLEYQLANLYLKSNNPKDAIASYKRILSINPKNILAANNLASLLLDDAGESGSMEEIKKLVRLFDKSELAPFLDTKGWYFFHAGNYADSVKTLKLALEKSPKNALFKYHLGMAYFKSGEHDEARPLLEDAVKSKSDFNGKSEAVDALNTINKTS